MNANRDGCIGSLLGEMTTKETFASVKRPNHFDTVSHDFLLF